MTVRSMLDDESARAFGQSSRDLDALAGVLGGRLIRPSDDEYDTARHIWNGMIDRYPAAIAHCASPDDVAAAVAFGRQQGLPIAVKGGGHNIAGLSVGDNAIVIDLADLNATTVDAASRTVRAGGGLTWAGLDAATQVAGLATTGGLISSTGVAGLTLGGGIGWLMRKHGLSCDNLISAEVVTAAGERLRASADEHPDLLWGLRGGGGNFGVVTCFEFELHPVDTILGGMVLWPADQAADVLAFFDDFAATAPDDLTALAALISAPPTPFVPHRLRLRPVVAVALCWSGDLAEGERTVAPLREFGSPVVDIVGPMQYLALQSMLDAGSPAGLRNYWKSGYLARLDEATVEVIRTVSAERVSPLSQIHIHQLGGAVARQDPTASAFSHRAATYAINVIATWHKAGDDRANVDWVRAAWSTLAPLTHGVYLNFLGDEGEDRVREAYDAPTWERLVELKRRYDPDNVFRLNQNIAPGSRADTG
jgi:FAD/FMN-containing dehydrogenase